MLEREHARLLLVHGGAAIVLAIGAAAWCSSRADREMLEHGADAVLHAPLVFAVLFALAAIVARSHRRGWVPWVARGARRARGVGRARGAARARDGGEPYERASRVGARRARLRAAPRRAHVRGQRLGVAEATLAPVAEADRWTGQGYFGARVRDAGVWRSIDNDYLPVLVAREGGVAGLIQGVTLLLVIVVGGGVIASIRLRHASREHRARWLVTAVVGSLAVYQPLASLGVLPLTGISWPGLGIDSPADLWLFVIGGVWCFMGGEGAVSDDERVRRTPRLARARGVAIAAIAIAGVAAIVVVARAGACALARVTGEDARIDTALQYAETIRCAWSERSGTQLEELVPALVAGTPGDDGTARFERELRAAWVEDRPKLLAALQVPAQPRSSAAPAGAAPVEAAPVGGGVMPIAAKAAGPIAVTPLGLAPPDDQGAAGIVLAGTRTKARAAPATDRRASEDAKRRAKRAPAGGKQAGGKQGGDKQGGDKRAGDKQAGADARDAADDQDADPAPDAAAAKAPPLPAPACRGRAGRWQLARDGADCVATFRAGWPAVRLAVRPHDGGMRATCTVTHDDDAISVLRAPVHAARAPRIRVVSAAMGVAASDVGEVVAGGRIVRMRVGAAAVELAALPPGLQPAGKVAIAPGVSLEVRDGSRAASCSRGRRSCSSRPSTPRGAAWSTRSEVVLDRLTLIVAGPAERRRSCCSGRRGCGAMPPVVDPLLADETNRVGDRARRAYPYGVVAPRARLGEPVRPGPLARARRLDPRRARAAGGGGAGVRHAHAARDAARSDAARRARSTAWSSAG